MTQKLSLNDHSRTSVGLRYVYPAMSRRSGGLSIGLNFNSNNACNWRCLYCQVPDLIRGSAPAMDFALLEQELLTFLHDVLKGDFYDRFDIAPAQRVIKDIAISGNGEPTSLVDFEQAVDLIGKIATELGILPTANFVLISNGSLMHQTKVQQGLKRLAHYGGEVWFKVDSMTEEGRKRLNNTDQSPAKAFSNLVTAANLCRVKLQTCLINYQGQGLIERESQAYLDFLVQLKSQTRIDRVMLYTIARPSFQPEAIDIQKMPEQVMENFANKINALGYEVTISR